jgi:hypothetical protein
MLKIVLNSARNARGGHLGDRRGTGCRQLQPRSWIADTRGEVEAKLVVAGIELSYTPESLHGINISTVIHMTLFTFMLRVHKVELKRY